MDQAVIYSFAKYKKDSMVASHRISKYLSDFIGCPIVDDERIADHPANVLIIVNSAYLYAQKVLPYLAEKVVKADRIIWVQNDYSIVPPKITSNGTSPFRRCFVEREELGKERMSFWSACEDVCTPGKEFRGHYPGPLSTYMNWNVLTYYEPETEPIKEHNGRLLYYGAFRANRRPYFDRYFDEPEIPVTISAPNMKFVDEYYSFLIEHEEKLDLKNEIKKFGLGLYLEDKYSHRYFTSPANRFYEMLSLGLPMVFQHESQKNLARAGYDVEEYVAHPGSLIEFMAQRDSIAASQQSEWCPIARREKITLSEKLKSFCEEAGIL